MAPPWSNTKTTPRLVRGKGCMMNGIFELPPEWLNMAGRNIATGSSKNVPKVRYIKLCTPQKFNSSPLKNDGWKTILSFWEGNFSGAMLNFRWVYVIALFQKHQKKATQTCSKTSISKIRV